MAPDSGFRVGALPGGKAALALIVLVAGGAAAGLLVRFAQRARDDTALPTASVVEYMSADEGDAGFARVVGPRPLRFPADAGPHEAYRTEWWYYTGNLADASGRRFGFQLTFFRTALAPIQARAVRSSAWATNQLYLAHFALADVAAQEFHSFERLARGAVGLAGAQADPFRVGVESWSASGTPTRLLASEGDVSIDLTVEPTAPPVLHGDGGYSPKGPDLGNASFYYSYTRLSAAGTVTSSEGVFRVTGEAWMDHEWSTSALDAAAQVGWDWFSLQLDDGSELMAFQIREIDGGISPESSGSLVLPDGVVVPLGREDFSLEALDTWTSPRTGAEYPGAWLLTVPGRQLQVSIEPLLADQELTTFIRYWEGAVRINGRVAGSPVRGHGYVELTGYDQARRLPGGQLSGGAVR